MSDNRKQDWLFMSQSSQKMTTKTEKPVSNHERREESIIDHDGADAAFKLQQTQRSTSTVTTVL
jgi:hypothetical protein